MYGGKLQTLYFEARPKRRSQDSEGVDLQGMYIYEIKFQTTIFINQPSLMMKIEDVSHIMEAKITQKSQI